MAVLTLDILRGPVSSSMMKTGKSSLSDEDPGVYCLRLRLLLHAAYIFKLARLHLVAELLRYPTKLSH